MASKKNLPGLKTKVNNLDVEKLKTVPADLSNLSNIVDNVVKKAVYNQLATNVNATDTMIPITSRLVSKTQYNSDKQGLEKKIEDFDKNYRDWKQEVDT